MAATGCTAQDSPPCSDSGALAVGPACIDAATGTVLSMGGNAESASEPIRVLVNASTVLDGCSTVSASASRSGSNLTVTRRLACGPTSYMRSQRPLGAVVREEWAPGPTPGSVLWTTEVSSEEGRFWTAPIQSQYAITDPKEAENMWIWTGATPGAGESARLEQDHTTLDPTPLSSFPATPAAVRYGGSDMVRLPKSAGSAASKPTHNKSKSWVVAKGVDAIPYANSTIPGVHALYGSTKTATDCESACRGNHTCSVWAWSELTTHCWFAFDGKWKPLTLSERTSGCDPSRVAACAAAPSPADAWDGSGDTALPIIVLIEKTKGYALSAVMDPSNQPNEAFLDRTAPGPAAPLVWHRLWFRLGNGTRPVVLRQHLMWHPNADWRGAARLLVEQAHADFFRPDPRANVSKVDGGGAYADYRGESDTLGVVGDDGVLIGPPSALGSLAPVLAETGFKTNWDSGEQFPSHGQWVPFNLTTGEPYESDWETCFSHPNFTAMQAHVPGSEAGNNYVSVCWKLNYTAWNGYYEDLHRLGFSSLTYGNYWEFGFDVRPTNSDLGPNCAATSPERWSNGPRIVAPGDDLTTRVRSMCDSNIYLRSRLPNAPFREWSSDGARAGSVLRAGMMGSAAMDAGDSDYQSHLVKMTKLLAARLPASDGVCFDGTGFGGYVNVAADDGRSWIELWPDNANASQPLLRGRKVRTQVSSMVAVTQLLGDVLHEGGRVHAHNTYAPRLGFWRSIDAVFSENGFRDDLMHSNSLLGMGGKPVVAWQPGCGRDPTFQQCPPRESWDWPTYEETNPATAQAAQRRMLMRLLYWGNQPTLPFPRNDHTVTPWIAERQGLNAVFRAFAPLFQRLRGRSWVLEPHAVNVISGAAQVNLFRVDQGRTFVAPVVFAPTNSKIELQLRGVALPCVRPSSGRLEAESLAPADAPSPVSVEKTKVAAGGAINVTIRFGSPDATPSPLGAANATSCALLVFRCV